MESFTLADFKKGIDNLKSWSPLRLLFSGGEPTLHRDLGEMLHYAKINGFQSILSTHGMFLKEKIKQIHENISWLDISLHSLESENYKKIRGIDSLAEVLEGIDAAIKLNVRIRLNFIILEENYHEVEEFLQFALKKGIKFVRFINEYSHKESMLTPKINYNNRKVENLKLLYSLKGLDIIIPSSNLTGTKQLGYLLLSKKGYLYANVGFKKRKIMYNFNNKKITPEFIESINIQSKMLKVKPIQIENH